MSKQSKTYRKLYWAFKIISLMLLFLPIAIFMVIEFKDASTTEQVTLGVGVVISAVFAAGNAIFKLAPRSSVWILIISLAIAAEKIQNVIYVTGACVIIEEVITSKLEKHFREKYKVNKEIDKRFDVNEDDDDKQRDQAEA